MKPPEKRRGKLYLVYGPPRSGKTKLIQGVLADPRFRELTHVVRCTTRNPRQNESDGREFFFMREEAFETSLQTGWFATCQDVGGVRYGLPYLEVDSCLGMGSDVLVEATTECAGELLANPRIHPDVVSIFIQPTLAVLAQSEGTAFEPEIVTGSLKVFPMSGQHHVVVNELIKENPDKKQGTKNPGEEALKAVLLGYRPRANFRESWHPAAMSESERERVLREAA